MPDEMRPRASQGRPERMPRRSGRLGRELAHLHAEQVGAQRVHDAEHEEPHDDEEPDAQQEEDQFTHRGLTAVGPLPGVGP